VSILFSMGIDKKKKQKKNLTRKKWLEYALEILIKEGNTKLRIDHLVRCMGVTKGSFYWHFKDRDDFILSLIEYWADVSSLGVVEHMKQIQGSAEERLLELMQLIVINDLARYDIAVRAWALMEPGVAHFVEETDKWRHLSCHGARTTDQKNKRRATRTASVAARHVHTSRDHWLNRVVLW